jgi:N4-gp56 family major capsid protein
VADAYTSTSSLDFDQVMWDRAAYYALRPELYFDSFADVKPTDTTPDVGSSVTFTFNNDLAVATTPLSETVDVDAVAMSDTQITLTPLEYGNAVVTTYRVRATSFMPVDRIAANEIGFNAGISQDTLARNIMQAGTNVRYASTAVSRVTVGAAMVLTAAQVRRAQADLEGANVPTFNGYYAAVIHTDQKYDLRGETGAAAWRDPHTYSQPQQIWNGEIGEFEGFRFMSSPRAPVFADAGVGGTVDVYGALFFGRQALAKVYSTYEGRGPYPITIMSPVTDKLKRFQPIGWHWYGAYGVFRQAALRRVETSSSIGAN